MALQVTFEALTYSLRKGIGALSRADVRARLAQLTEAELQETCGRVQRGKVAAPWSDEEAKKLIATWKEVRRGA
jgi:hypothetical protein